MPTSRRLRLSALVPSCRRRRSAVSFPTVVAATRARHRDAARSGQLRVARAWSRRTRVGHLWEAARRTNASCRLFASQLAVASCQWQTFEVGVSTNPYRLSMRETSSLRHSGAVRDSSARRWRQRSGSHAWLGRAHRVRLTHFHRAERPRRPLRAPAARRSCRTLGPAEPRACTLAATAEAFCADWSALLAARTLSISEIVGSRAIRLVGVVTPKFSSFCGSAGARNWVGVPSAAFLRLIVCASVSRVRSIGTTSSSSEPAGR